MRFDKQNVKIEFFNKTLKIEHYENVKNMKRPPYCLMWEVPSILEIFAFLSQYERNSIYLKNEIFTFYSRFLLSELQ